VENIKNIIFDLGGVFVEINYYDTEKSFVDLGVADFHDIFNQHKASPLFEKLETGNISEDEFYRAFKEKIKIELTNQQIKTAWNAMLGKFYVEHLDWLKDIKNRYKIYLLSNTNVIHYDAVMQIYKEQFGREDFNENFRTAYYSHELKIRKPLPESFKAVVEKEKLLPEETLFIDDTFKNIEGAKQIGLNTIHLQKPEMLLALGL
jgi:putative hydrolase of the HAD superfamily